MNNASPTPTLSLDYPPGYKQSNKPYLMSDAAACDTVQQKSTLEPHPLLAALAERALSKAPAPSKGIDPLDVLTQVRAFDGAGEITEAYIENDIGYFINKFYASEGSRGHSLHAFPYRACFNPQLAAFFIDLLSREGDTVHDPFLGRGTTALQSVLMERIAFGSDINPLSLLMTRPRLDPAITTEAIDEALAGIDFSKGNFGRDDLAPFFHTATQRKLSALREYFSANAPLHIEEPDPTADFIRMAVLSRLTGHSSGYCSGYTLPPNQMRKSITAQQRYNEEHVLTPPERDVAAIIADKSRKLLKDGPVPLICSHTLGIGAAWDTPWIPDASVDLVFTSPPFGDVVNYAEENWLRMWFAGIDGKDVAFSHHKSLDDWTAMIRYTLIEMMRVVKSGGYIAMEVGEIKRGSVALERLVWAAAEGLLCRRVAVIIHNGGFTKSSNIYGVRNGVLGTNTNRVVILQRE